MILVAGGDSFVYGSELKDCNVNINRADSTIIVLLLFRHY
jgi:hypothetical protein